MYTGFMDENNPEQISQEDVPVRPRTRYQIIFKSSLFVLLAIVIGLFIGQFIGNRNTLKTTNDPIPTNSQIKPTELSSIDAFKKDTLYMANTNGIIFLEYNDNFFTQNEKTAYALEDANASVSDPENHKWIEILEKPGRFTDPEGLEYNSLFDFKIAPDGHTIYFIMRWSQRIGEILEQSFHVYQYDVENPSSLKEISHDLNGVPVISQISNNGNYIAFKTFGCWNCTSGHPGTKLFRLSDSKTKDIGKTAFFSWKDNGNYEFKKAVQLPCPTEKDGTEGGCYVQPYEDAANLPLEYGSF